MNTDSHVIAWRAWYDVADATAHYDSEHHTLEDLPDDGFQAMRLWYKDGTGRFISGNDYYFFYERPDGIVFAQTNETPEQILARYPQAVIKRGRYVPDAVSRMIEDEMAVSKTPCESC